MYNICNIPAVWEVQPNGFSGFHLKMFAKVWFVHYSQAYASYINSAKENTAIYFMIQYIAVVALCMWL